MDSSKTSSFLDALIFSDILPWSTTLAFFSLCRVASACFVGPYDPHLPGNEYSIFCMIL